MRIFIPVSMLLIASACLVATEQATAPQPPQRQSETSSRGISVRWSVDADVYKATTAICATVDISNNSKETIFLGVRTPLAWINPTVSINGNRVPFTRYGSLVLERSLGMISYKLLPGESHREQICLNRYFDLSVAGAYQAAGKVSYEVSGKSDTIEITTRPIGFRVDTVNDIDLFPPAKVDEGAASGAQQAR